jgi:SNF2 family DNA or RNA helicase
LDTPDLDRNISKSIENQAVGRAVRFGQTKTVNVYKMIMKNTVEENFI